MTFAALVERSRATMKEADVMKESCSVLDGLAIDYRALRECFKEEFDYFLLYRPRKKTAILCSVRKSGRRVKILLEFRGASKKDVSILSAKLGIAKVSTKIVKIGEVGRQGKSQVKRKK